MYHLAQLNIGRILAPLDDPRMDGFVNRLDEVNALAEGSPGFIWRLQTEEGDATAIRPYDDEKILVNMSVWVSIEELTAFVYAQASMHRDVMKGRRQWFERFEGPFVVLWWVPQGHIPTVEEAKERLDHLRMHGPTGYAFSFKKPFPPPDTGNEPVTLAFEECLT